MRRLAVVAIAVTTMCLLQVSAAHADDHAALPSVFTTYAARGIKTNLPDLAGHVVHRTLGYEDTHFVGLGYRHDLLPPKLLQWAYLDRLTTGVELIGVRHRGLQDHVETSLAYTLSTPELHGSGLRARLGYSLGVSYAFDEPTYERTPDGDHRRWLTYMAYELELGLQRYERVSFVTRVHHRSGAYGLFAPRGSGSNFLAVGLRVHLGGY
jgi:hypothetical protein